VRRFNWIINPFQGDSVVAFIGIAASLCAVLINFKTAKRLKRNQMVACNTI
jgi:hypothetical protein